jgi:pSer/pThr/pTyr-binding forkhead associated (FHA) protein
VFEIPPAGLVLGRGTDADVRVASEMVARKHVRLSWVRGALVAEDLRSTNGTRINGLAASEPTTGELRAGDVLTLAHVYDFEVADGE